LVHKRFAGSDDLARSWVADLGRASYYANTKPYISLAILTRWARMFPSTVLWRYTLRNGFTPVFPKLNNRYLSDIPTLPALADFGRGPVWVDVVDTPS
jgi:hypothetical protein